MWSDGAFKLDWVFFFVAAAAFTVSLTRRPSALLKGDVDASSHHCRVKPANSFFQRPENVCILLFHLRCVTWCSLRNARKTHVGAPLELHGGWKTRRTTPTPRRRFEKNWNGSMSKKKTQLSRHVWTGERPAPSRNRRPDWRSDQWLAAAHGK